MPSNKSQIRDAIESFVSEKAPAEGLLDRKDIFVKLEKRPKDGFPWENCERHIAAGERKGHAYGEHHLHTIFDGYQTLEHITPEMSSARRAGRKSSRSQEAGDGLFSVPDANSSGGGEFKLRWKHAARNFCRAQQRLFDESYNTTVPFSTETMVLAFDNGKCVSKAKAPEQIERRRLRMKQAANNGVRIELEDHPDNIEFGEVDPNAYIPADWRTRTVLRQYRESILDYLLSETLSEARGVRSKEGSRRRFYVWRNGEMAASKAVQKQRETQRGENGPSSDWARSSGDDEDYDDLEPVDGSAEDGATGASSSKAAEMDDDMLQNNPYSCMGEFDYFALRYILNTVSEMVSKRKRKLQLEDVSRHDMIYSQQSYVYNMRSLVFRVVTTDTDLLLFTLWTLEHIQHRYGLNGDQVPQVYFVAPWAPYRVIDVMALFCSLKYELRGTARGEPDYVVRSFCTAFMFWGGDLMPSPYFLTPKSYLDAYIDMNELIGTSLCCGSPSESRDDEDGCNQLYPFATHLNGRALRILYILAYGVRWVWYTVDRDTMKEIREEVEGELGSDADAKVKKLRIGELVDVERAKIRKEALKQLKRENLSVSDLEALIRSACAGENPASIAVTKRGKLAQNKRPPSDGSVLMARVGLLSHNIFCLDNALACEPGWTTSLRDIGFLYEEYDYYANSYDEIMGNLTEREKSVVMGLGLVSADKCYRWSDAILRKGDDPSVSSVARGDSLGALAAKVFSWPGLESEDSSDGEDSLGAGRRDPKRIRDN